jgi:ribosome biogenesis GTPase
VSRARVIRSAKREFECKIIETGEVVIATALGNLVKKKESIVVGDYVELDKIDDGDEFQISKREERKNEIFRIIIREQKKKVTAANCDVLVILCSVSKPEFKRGLLDRYLVRAYQWQIEPVVVFNKMDEYTEDLFDIKFETDRLKELGVKCYETSAKYSDYKIKYLDEGVEQLKNYLKGKTSIFLGQSGVGKSKSINALSGGEVELRTKTIGKGGKGSHTTTWSEIIECGDFTTIDSPGIRSFSLDDIDPELLMSYFPDLDEIAVNCKFTNCTHEENAKGCRFWLDHAPDTREGQLIHSRLDSFKKIFAEANEIPAWKKNV